MALPAESLLRLSRDLPKHLRLTGLLGSGSQKSVYGAFDEERDEEIAIICFDRNLDSALDVDRLHELRTLTRISAHAHVLPLLDVVEAGEFLLLCVPYMSGGDLGTRLRATAPEFISIKQALQIGVQIADALSHVHRHGLIHGDVKAENVLLAADGSARLADFGLAHLGQIPMMAKLMGTLTHIAPERIRGDEADARSDLYSFGCLLYELFSGRMPLSADNSAELLNLHLMARPRALSRRRPEIPIVVSQLVDRLLEKHPEARPGTALEVFGALSAALHTEAFLADERHRSVPLPSRAEPEAALDRLATLARDGHPKIVALTGELGSGKSETLRRFARRAQGQGFGVSIGVAKQDGAVPYSPMIDALMGLAGDLGDLEPSHADRLRSFLYLGVPTEADNPLERGVTQERLFASIFSALSAVSQRRPTILILEDMQDADEASLDLLAYLDYTIDARQEHPGLDLLIVVSCRSESLPDQLDALLSRGDGQSRSAPTSQMIRIELDRLELPDVVSLSEAHGLPSPPRTLVEEIANASEGNALNAVEIVRRLRRAGEHAGSPAPRRLPTSLADSTLPVDSERLIADRIEALSQNCRAVLELAATVGLDIAPPLLDRLAASHRLDVASGLAEAVDCEVLIDRGDSLAFSHPLIREGLLRGVPDDERAQIHLEYARGLLVDDPIAKDRHDVEVAHHLIAAGDHANPRDRVLYATRAGGHAMSRFAWSEAARYFEAAIDALRPESDRRDRASLHHRSGFAFFRLLEADACFRHFDRAMALYTELDDVAMCARIGVDRIRAITWMGLTELSKFDRSREELERSLGALGASHRELRASILAALAEHCWAKNDPVRAEDLCLRALQTTRPEVDHVLRAKISVTLGLAQLSRLNQHDALATWRFGALHGRRADDLLTTAQCMQRAQLALFVSGRIDEARALSEEVGPMNRILRLPGEAAFLNAIVAAIAVLEGDFERAEKEFKMGIDQLWRARYPWALLLITPTLACARALAGNSAGALSALEGLVESPITAANRTTMEVAADRHRALVNYFVGDPVRFSSHRREELIAQLETKTLDENSLYQACLALELASAEQDAELARPALPIVVAALERGWLITTGWPFYLPRLVGVGHLLLGNVSESIAALEQALLTPPLERLPIERSRVRCDLARARVLSHDPGELDIAIGHAREAVHDLEAYPRNAFLERAEMLVRYLESLI